VAQKQEKDILLKLYKVVQSRKKADPETSYAARLYRRGRLKICQKLGEEAVETVIAALAESKKATISESADMLFHLTVLWAEMGIKPQDVMKELEGRMGKSGVAEKASRGKTAKSALGKKPGGKKPKRI
jgi:phosphoribosyl-ATP pyrophosphohydrolase